MVSISGCERIIGLLKIENLGLLLVQESVRGHIDLIKIKFGVLFLFDKRDC